MDDNREENIRKSAYHKWESEGRPAGQHDKHWRDAESEFSTIEQEEHKGSDQAAKGGAIPSSELPKVGNFSSATNET